MSVLFVLSVSNVHFCLLLRSGLDFGTKTDKADKTNTNGHVQKKVALEIDFLKCVLKIVIALCWLIYIISIYTFGNSI